MRQCKQSVPNCTFTHCFSTNWWISNSFLSFFLQLWGNDAKAEATVLWPLHAKCWLIGKDSDAGRDWRQEEKGTTEDEMAGWHHRLDGHEFGWTLGVGDGERGLACCDSWCCKESDTTEILNSKLLSKHRLIFGMGHYMK